MQKYLKILEEHVEWIALGIGGLFLLYMIYGYVFSPVVPIEGVGATPLAPGEIDEKTLNEPAQQLEIAMRPEGGSPRMDIPDLTGSFHAAMEIANYTPPQYAGLFWSPPAPKLDGGRAPGEDPRLPGVEVITDLFKLTPAVPSATPAHGRSTVNVSGQNVAPAAPLFPGAGGGAGAIAAAGNPKFIDLDWVSVSFTINPAEIIKAYEDAKYPPRLFGASLFLRVELIREELVNGKVVKTDVIGPLKHVQIPPMPNAVKPNMVDAVNYEEWVKKSGADLVPAFYPVMNGEQWYKPGAANPNIVVAPVNAAPAEPPPPVNPQNPRRPNPNQQPTRPPNQQNRPPTGPPGMYAPQDRERPLELAQAVAQPDIFAMPQGNPGGVNPGAGAAGVPAANLVPIPWQNFDPAVAAQQGQFFEVVLHDDTAQPGKTYQYKIRYTMRNLAAFQANLFIKGQKDKADTWAIVSPESKPTSPVTIPSRVNFFVNRLIPTNARNAAIEVFKWQDGKQHSTVVTVGVGDQVGTTVNGIDYSTGWTVVDFRPDPQNSNARMLLLVDAQGKLQRRSFDADQADPTLKQLRQDIQRNALPGAVSGDIR